jgi:hypothetical protein
MNLLIISAFVAIPVSCQEHTKLFRRRLKRLLIFSGLQVNPTMTAYNKCRKAQMQD